MGKQHLQLEEYSLLNSIPGTTRSKGKYHSENEPKIWIMILNAPHWEINRQKSKIQNLYKKLARALDLKIQK